MTAKKKDVDAILPEQRVIEVAGIPATVKRIRTREAIGLWRVIVHGLGANIANINWAQPDKKALGQGLLLMALADAEDEVLLFLNEIVDCVDPGQSAELVKALRNPDVDDLFKIVETVIDQEWSKADELWGKVVGLMDSLQTKKATTAGE